MAGDVQNVGSYSFLLKTKPRHERRFVFIAWAILVSRQFISVFELVHYFYKFFASPNFTGA